MEWVWNTILCFITSIVGRLELSRTPVSFLHSESSLPSSERVLVLVRNTNGLNVGKLLSLDHLNSVTLFVHHQSSLFALNDRVMLIVLPLDLVLLHLSAQVALVVHEHLSSLCILCLLFLFLLLLLGDNGQELLTLHLRFLLQARVDIGELSLAALMQILDVSVMLGFFLSLLCPELQLSLLKSFLRTNLSQSSLPVIGTLLQVSQSLHLALFLLLNKLLLSGFRLLPLNFLSLELGDLLIDAFLCLAGGHFGLLRILVGDPDFLVHDLDAFALGVQELGVLASIFLNVSLQLGFLQLGLVFQLMANELSVGDLVDEDLLAAFSGLSCPFFSGHLLLDGFKPLNLHHHI